MLKSPKQTALRQVAPSPEDIFIENYDQLRIWALHFSEGDRELAEDLLHDAFMQVTVNEVDFAAIDNTEAYLYVVMRNLRISQVRRATRSPIRPLSVVEFDTANVGFWASDPRDRIRLREELFAVCEYACLRKESAKAGSVLIFRFFHGYYPEEISRVMRVTPLAVKERLRLARSEARLYLEDPHRLSFIQKKSIRTKKPQTDRLSGDLRLELRRIIFGTREGECFSADDLREAYKADAAEWPNTTALAHIVSCQSCIENVNSLLGLGPLASRYPIDTVGNDPGKRGGGDSGSGTGGGAAGGSKMLDTYISRRDEMVRHEPEELRISVNGYIQGSHKVASDKNEMTLVIDAAENLGFVEVFSEQGIRLLMLNVEPLPRGETRQAARAHLSDGRTLDANLSFSGTSPVLQVIYQDPNLTVEAVNVTDAPFADSVGNGDLSPQRRKDAEDERGSTGWLSRQLNKIDIFQPIRLTVAISALLIGAIGYWFINQPPKVEHATARAVLTEARNVEYTLASAPDNVLHRNYQVEEWSNGDLQERRRVDEWQSKAKSAKRSFDEQGRMIAGEWRSDDTRRVFQQGQKLQSLDKSASTDQTYDLADPTPSASAFANLLDQYDVTSRVTVDELPTAYTFHYEDDAAQPMPLRNISGTSSKLLTASLTLDRNTMLPTAESIVLQIGDETREYRFTDVRVEQKPLTDVSPAIFEPEPELAKGATKVQTPLSSKEGCPDGRSGCLADTGAAPAAAVPTSASLETEVEVFKVLDSINALSGEQITVTRTPNGQLKVTGIVDSATRKTEILNALATVKNEPGLSIDIETALEAANRKKQQTAPTQSAQIKSDTVTAETQAALPVEPELRAYFSGRGVPADRLDAEVRRYASGVLNRSEALSRDALALKSLAERFSPAEIDRLEPAKRDEWKSLIRVKAAAVAGDVRSLESQLSAAGLGLPAGVGGAASADSLVVSSQRLFGLAAACERQVNQSFSITSGGSSSAVKSVQFWCNLAQMSAIAAEIQKF